MITPAVTTNVRTAVPTIHSILYRFRLVTRRLVLRTFQQQAVFSWYIHLVSVPSTTRTEQSTRHQHIHVASQTARPSGHLEARRRQGGPRREEGSPEPEGDHRPLPGVAPTRSALPQPSPTGTDAQEPQQGHKAKTWSPILTPYLGANTSKGVGQQGGGE